MPLDPALLAETRAWLIEAAKDFRSAELLLQGEPELASRSAFHVQQAAEKILKAFLTWRGERITKTHSLVRLGKACVKLDAGLEQVSREVGPISGWAVETRYPGGWNAPTPAEVTEAIETVRQLRDAILSRLPPEVKP
jgi:HEPN domain-containing protein